MIPKVQKHSDLPHHYLIIIKLSLCTSLVPWQLASEGPNKLCSQSSFFQKVVLETELVGDAATERDGEILCERDGEILCERDGEILCERDGEILCERDGEILCERDGTTTTTTATPKSYVSKECKCITIFLPNTFYPMGK